MKSLRFKLILVVLGIALISVLAVLISSIVIVRDGQRETVQASDRQVSDLLSRSVLSQLSDYRNKLNFIYDAWKLNADFKVDKNLFPDFLWLKVTDVSDGKGLLEWMDEARLKEWDLSPELVLGRKKSGDLFEEVKYSFRKVGDWYVYNSTIQPLHPTFLLVSAFGEPGKEDMTHIAFAEIHAEKLFSSVKSKKGQQLILVDSHQNILLSTAEGWDPSDVVFADQGVMNVLKDLKEGQSVFKTFDYPHRDSQATSIYKFKDAGGVGIVLQTSEALMREAEGRIQTLSLLAAFVVMLIAVNLLILFANSITSPLTQLMKMMEKVGRGEFTGKIVVKSKDEIGRLAAMFNKMLVDLKTREQEVESAKSRLVQSEKMSAFGQMSAGIAHEVKNPLAGILGYAQMSKKKLPSDSPIQAYLDIIEKETVRCKEIVENLMKFARQEKAAMSRIDVNKAVKDSIRLVEHQIGISGIKLVQMYALEGAPIWLKGNSNQLQQVMMNLLLNAQQAMENRGTITVSTHYSPESGKVIVMVSDTGPGMTEEVKQRIFEPFFTTKGVGKGTGLGLSVSIGIIKDHNGTIEVDSAVGKGTTFTISLPVEQDQTQQPEAAQAS